MRFLCALAAVLFAVPSARGDDVHDAPPGQMRFRTFGGDDGLRNLVITSIAQDPSGFLWLATDDGVYRFDGERFRHFSHQDGLPSSLIFVIGIGAGGAPCVGGIEGMVCWDGDGFSHAGAQGLPAVPIYAMASHGGRLWVGTEGAGLYVQGNDRQFVPAPGWPGKRSNTIRALWADADGVVVGDGATVQLSAGGGAWRTIGDVGLASERIDGVLRDRDGALWIRTGSHMWLVPAGAARATDVTAGLPSSYGNVDAPTVMAIGPRGNVLVGTDRGIAYRMRDAWRVIDHAHGLPNASVRTLFVDREGTLWAGATGLVQMRGRGLLEYHDPTSGLPGDVAWTFKRDREGTLWVGTNQCAARAVHGRWECLPGTEGRTVRSIVFPPQGGVFLGGAPSDLLYIDPQGRATSISEPDTPPDRLINALALGPEGDLWVATRGGLFRLRGAVPGRLERVTVPGASNDSWVLSLITVDDRLWVGAEGGVFVHEHGAWHVIDQRAGLLVSAASYLARRADGRMCVAYREAFGVSCFRYDGGVASAFEHIEPVDEPTAPKRTRPEQGLTSGMVYLLGEDRERRLWVGSGSGIDVVSSSGIDHFDESDGMVGNDSAATAFLLDEDGSLWLGASHGATHVFAQHYDGPPRAPRTTFLDGQLGDRRFGAAQAGLAVPHGQNALTIDFASSSLLELKRVDYQVRLWPLETRWRTIHLRQVVYPAMPPDSYRFEVRARIGAGAWGPTSEVHFVVLPAWWRTGWFYLLIASVTLGAIAVAFTWRQRTVLRRRTRQLHDRADATFRAVIDLMPDLISVHRDGKLIYMNAANRRLFGVDGPLDRWRDFQMIERVHPDDRAIVRELFRKIREGDPQSREVIEIRTRGADGNWRICEVSGVLVELGGMPTVVASARDVTERKRMRAKLLVSDRMASLGTLAAGIAHEINNPLSYVAGNLEAMAETFRAARGRPSDHDCAELVDAITDARDGAERVRKIVQGLRSFSRSEDEQRVALALPGVLEAAMRLTGNEVRHRAQLVRELGPVPSVIADDGRLTQVFINLLINATHAIPEGRSNDNRITVRTRTDPHGRAVVEIEDTGKGMPPEVQARVFDPFFTTKDIGEGTGLGLSICHGIISGLGGQISIDSASGQGTIVRVVLPAAPESAVAPPRVPAPASEPRRSGHQRPRVLLVDDEPQVAHTMERLLRKDYDVTTTVTGRDALDLIAQGRRFDAIISDVMMPNMTGIELIEELQRAAPDQAQRVIFLSGGAFTAQTRERLDQLGAPQLEKPITASELRACVKQMVLEAPPLGSSDARPADARLG